MQEPIASDERALDDDVVRHGGVEPELVLVARDAHVLRIEDERAHTARSRLLLVGTRKEQEGAGVPPVRDPLLGAGDPPAVALRVGARPQCAGVGAGLGLGQGERTEMLAPRERRHEAGALLLRPVREQRQRRRARVHRNRDTDTRVGTRELLQHDDVGEEVGAGAAVLLRHAHAHQAELGELREDVPREPLLAVPLGGVRLDLLPGEIPGQRPGSPSVPATARSPRADYSRAW